MRERLLVRHFLWRFIEHDLISSGSDRRQVLALAGAAVASFSLFMAVLVALAYQFSPNLPPGLASVASIDDRFMFVTSSMLVMALAAVAQWDALMLDPRDTAVLGVLPIPRAQIVGAKFTATALFALGVLLAWSFFPTVTRVAALPIQLPIGLGSILTLTLATGLVTMAAGAFGFVSVLGFRELLYAAAGPERFRRVSLPLQALLVALLTTGMLLLPSSSSDIASRWLAKGGTLTTVLPPFWFIGLHEQMVGHVIDDLPRSVPPRFLQRQEAQATVLYRSLWPRYRQLATIAPIALLSMLGVAASLCLWNSRRLPIHTSAGRERTRATWWQRLAVRWLANSDLEGAGFLFATQTLARCVSHRIVMAAAVGVGVSFTVLVNRRAPGTRIEEISAMPLALLAAQPLVIGCVLGGFRHATRLPAELRAGTTFGVSWPGDGRGFLSGVKRGGWIGFMLPALVVLAAWHLVVLSPRVSAAHFLIGALLSIVWLEAMFFRERRVPFVSSYVQDTDAKAAAIVQFIGLMTISFGFAWLERWALGGSKSYVALLAGLATLAVAAAVAGRYAPSDALPVPELEEAVVFPTQRLYLAQ